MHLKIRCDGESEKFCKIFWELNKALVKVELVGVLLIIHWREVERREYIYTAFMDGKGKVVRFLSSFSCGIGKCSACVWA